MSKLQIYTDGASSPRSQKQPGGWAYAYVGDNILVDSKYDGEAPTTNQRMEMMGVIRGLEDLSVSTELVNQYDTVEIITDSAYVYRCMVEKWYINWQYENWTRKDFDGNTIAIKNKDLWLRMLGAVNYVQMKGIRVTWTKIRGHKGIIYNEVVDKLAVKGKQKVS